MMNTKNTPARSVAAAITLGLMISASSASADTKREHAGVIGGAVIGAAAGGPVGMFVGAAVGGHFAHRGQRIVDGQMQIADLDTQLHDINSRLSASTLELEQVEGMLAARNARIAEQTARIEALAEDQILLSALELRVRFATGDTEVSEEDHETLAILGRYLERHPEARVRLDGHADARGPAEDNETLSLARALAVGEAIAVSERQIDIRAMGEKEAVAPSEDIDGLARERRVDVRLVGPEAADPRSASVD